MSDNLVYLPNRIANLSVRDSAIYYLIGMMVGGAVVFSFPATEPKPNGFLGCEDGGVVIRNIAFDLTKMTVPEGQTILNLSALRCDDTK